MCKKLIVLTCFVLSVCLVNSVSALELAVDLVYPEVTSPAKHDLTHDSGFTAFVTSPTNWGHDLWAHDPRTMTDIDGSGISVRLACGYEGDTSMKVLGMKPVGDNQTATGTPSGDPIANSWVISHRHWGNNPIDVEGRLSWGSVYLRFYGPGLVPGRYRLRSYHNAPPNPADPDWDITEGNDVMPSISVWGPEVTPLVELADVQIQHVESDAELVPVDIEFELCGVYDGTGENTVTIRFESPPGGDRQQGGAAVLNAFILYVASGGMASCPDPADGAENVCPGVELTWNPGSHPAYHDVYLGTAFDDVNEASTSDTRGVYMSRLPGEDTNYAPVGLELGQTYYWRVDEVNDVCSPYLWKGTVWSLTTNDGTAFNPNPQDGSVFIPLDANLSWTPGCLATWNDVYFGTSFNDVNDANSSLPAGTSVYKGRYAADANEYDDPASMAKGTLYYWRIDSIGDTNSWKGQVWSFRTIVDPDIVVYYKFEETIGNTVADYSGLDYLGWVRDSGPETWEPNDGYDGGCIYFDGDGSVIVPRETLTLVDRGISFSVWVNNVRGGGDMPVLDAGDDGTAGALKLTALVPSEAGDVSWRAGDDTDDVLVWPAVKPADLIGDWHLFVFVKDEDEEPTGKMSIYFDGSLAESKDDVNTASLANVSRNTGGRMFRLGSFNDEDGQYEGRLDDFRMYKRALSASDVAELFRGEDLGLAYLPSPYDGERDVAVDVNLSWSPGDYAQFHDLYLGTNFQDVNTATTSDGTIYKGRNGLADTLYDPPTDLEFETTYYWRIDEVNDPCLWKGKVWRFTTANYIIIDNFESYDDGNRIWYTWEDSGVNWSGATLDLGVEPFAPAYTGSQSMLYYYDNEFMWDFFSYHSYAELPFDPPLDMTYGGQTKVLTLYFYGDPTNDANETEQLYAALIGSYAEYRYSDDGGNDNNDIKLAEWTEWNIPLNEFTNPDDVDETQVTKLRIAFGDRNNDTTPGGKGVVYFDDIRLYPPRCIPELGPVYDLSGNCVVEYGDIGVIAVDWLKTDLDFRPPQAPPGPAGHWALDGNGNDSTANGNNGTAEGTYAWVAGKIGPNSIEFSGDGGRVLVPDAPELNLASQVSVCVWVNPAEEQDSSARVVVKGADNKENYAIQMPELSPNFLVRDVCDISEEQDAASNVDLEIGEWAHIAGSYDGSEVKIYVNGHLANSEAVGSFSLVQDSNGLGIGNRSDANDRAFIGKIDDVQVYNVALSQGYVVYLASEGTGYVPVDSPAELYWGEPEGQRAVNLRDVAVLLDHWLEVKLWP